MSIPSLCILYLSLSKKLLSILEIYLFLSGTEDKLSLVRIAGKKIKIVRIKIKTKSSAAGMLPE